MKHEKTFIYNFRKKGVISYETFGKQFERKFPNTYGPGVLKYELVFT